MISRALALQLRLAGLVWRPAKGDCFQLIAVDSEAASTVASVDEPLERSTVAETTMADVFTISDMTIEPHDYSTGMVLGFNGTTEWALDSVSVDDAVWVPREDQLREALRHTFRALEWRDEAHEYVVTTVFLGRRSEFRAGSAPEAYGLAVLEQVIATR